MSALSVSQNLLVIQTFFFFTAYFSLVRNEKRNKFPFLSVGFSHFLEIGFRFLSPLDLVRTSFFTCSPLWSLTESAGFGFLFFFLNTGFQKVKGSACNNSSKRHTNTKDVETFLQRQLEAFIFTFSSWKTSERL